MSVQKRITEKNPRTGALPSEQSAQSKEQQQGGAGSGMLESDKLIYQLVENNVGFAGEQFGENLRFNSEVLTNVLYDNIYDLLGEKLEENEFVEWIADELVKSGCVTKQESEQEQKPKQQQEPKEEVVYELDDSAYTELKAKVGAAIELIKANRLTIFKLFSDVDNHIKSLSDASDKYQLDYDTILLKRRDEEITLLVHRLQSNQQKIEDHILITNDIRDEIDEKVDEVQLAIEQAISDREKSAVGNRTIIEGLQNTWQKIGENFNGFNKEQDSQYNVFDKPMREINDAITKFRGEQEETYETLSRQLAEQNEQREKEKKEQDELQKKEEKGKAKLSPKKEQKKPEKKPQKNVLKPQPPSSKEEKKQATKLDNKLKKRAKDEKGKIIKKLAKKPVLELETSGKGVVQKVKKIIVVVVPKGMKKPKKSDIIKFVLANEKKKGVNKSKVKKFVDAFKPRRPKQKTPKALGQKRLKRPMLGKMSRIEKKRAAKKLPVLQRMADNGRKMGRAMVKPLTPPKAVAGKQMGVEKPSIFKKLVPSKFTKAGIQKKVRGVVKSKFLQKNVFKPAKQARGAIVKGWRKSSSAIAGKSRALKKSTVKSMRDIGRKFQKKVAPSARKLMGSVSEKIQQFKPLGKIAKSQTFQKIAKSETFKSVSSTLRKNLPKMKEKVVGSVKEKFQKVGKSKFFRQTIQKMKPASKVKGYHKKLPVGIAQKPGPVGPPMTPKRPKTQKGICVCPICGHVHRHGAAHEVSDMGGGGYSTPVSVPMKGAAPVKEFGKKPLWKRPFAKDQTMPYAQPYPTQGFGGKFKGKTKGFGQPQVQPVPIPMPNKHAGLFGKLIGKVMQPGEEEQKKPTLKERIQMRITQEKMKIKKTIKGGQMGQGIANIKQGFGQIKQSAKKVWGGIKKVGKGIFGVAKLGWKAVKGVYKVAKGTVKMGLKAGKAFIGASRAVGKFAAKAAWGGMKLIGRGVKGIVKGIMEDIEDAKGGKAAGHALGKAAKEGRLMSELNSRFGFKDRGLVAKVVNFSGAMMLTKFVLKAGFKILKWGVKMLWKGLKKLVALAVTLFKTLFRLGGKFVNKLSTWMYRLGKGVVNVAYRFLVKPIANMMVSVFSFFSGLLMGPINFMKWLIPSVFDKIHMVLGYIGQGVGRLLKATWGIFKKLLFNPITIMLIIAGIFWIFKDSLMKWLGGGLQGIKDSILPTLKAIGTWLWEFAQTAWSVISAVGSFIFEWVEKITNPDGWIMTTIIKIVKALFAIKKWIKKMMKAAGKDSIDIFCMFLAGDMIGIVLNMMVGVMIKMWKYLKRRGLFKAVLGMVSCILGFHLLILGLAATFLASILNAGWALVKWLTGKLTGGLVGGGSLGDIVDAFCAPWKYMWEKVTSVFSGGAFSDENDKVDKNHTYMNVDPGEVLEEKATNTKVEVRNLGQKGKADNLAKLKSPSGEALGKLGAEDLINRIKTMNSLYQWNVEQSKGYAEFISDAWDKGKGNDDSSQTVMRIMLESPEISQRLLSVFFYFNPQTEETMMLRPSEYIGAFVKNIQELVNDPDRDNQEAFQKIIEAFDQLNKERQNLINGQGDVLVDFSKKLNDYASNKEGGDSEENQKAIAGLIDKMNNGDLFDKVKYDESFNQLAVGDAQSQDIESVTGSELGSNDLLVVPRLTTPANGGAAIPRDKFVAKPEPPPPRNKIGRVTLPPTMYPPPLPNPDMTNDGKSLYELWMEHQQTRRDRIDSGESEEAVEADGYKAMDYDEFKDWYEKAHQPSEEEQAAREENKAKRLASMRLAADIDAFNHQGKEASADGFQMGSEPTVLSIPLDGVSQTLLMFSPDWHRVQGASGKSDDEFLLDMDQEDAEARERLRKAKEEEERKKEEERLKQEREQAILDYSAKVSKDGYIEIKIGEDIPAMTEAWKVHMDKRREFINAGHSEEEADKAGLKNYNWEEWKRYYRKMHGLPEDGIKRIKLDEEMQKKPRDIDWSPRAALSAEELGKYGIEVSEEGPVMIPLEKAMEVANQLLAQAKTIYSIRDGLEVMRVGLQTETKTLKERREGGVPTAVLATGGEGGGQSTVDPYPTATSDYSSQAAFESRF